MFVIDDGCIGCGVCVGSCPFDAIIEEEDGTFSIDCDLCVSCGACLGDCPVDAIWER